MTMTNIIEFNKEKAYEYFAKENSEFNVTVEDLEHNGEFYDNLHDVFEWIYEDESNSVEELEETIDLLAEVTVEQMRDAGVGTAAEYLAITWENLHVTPYGYVKWYV